MSRADRHLLILSGPTQEYIDPVRFIGNASSGLTGKAIAEEALRRNHSVDFVSGPVHAAHLPAPGVKGRIHPVTGAREMLAVATGLFERADLIIFVAAVADYEPIERLDQKIEHKQQRLVLEMLPTPDIAATLSGQKRENQKTIGFALQTHEGEDLARRKLEDKQLDGIVLNDPAAIGSASAHYLFLRRGTELFEKWGRLSKHSCAARILDLD